MPCTFRYFGNLTPRANRAAPDEVVPIAVGLVAGFTGVGADFVAVGSLIPAAKRVAADDDVPTGGRAGFLRCRCRHR